jgi:hypothetical protein
MSVNTLRLGWLSIRKGMTLGCGATLAAALVVDLLVCGCLAIYLLAVGDIRLSEFLHAEAWLMSGALLLGGFVLTFWCVAIQGTVAGGVLGLTLHALAPRVSSLTKSGMLLGCLLGALAGGHSLLSIRTARYGVGGHPVFVLVMLAVSALVGGWVGRRLALRELAGLGDRQQRALETPEV